ncbi:hypothetical protein [Neisseria iguanae]|uniref:hypothetical protein n=1 Tax=Neisseria iguanae TaxID=90242 RepID=UPI0014730A61|nr:hypothetical protein [Neisseria iguanae]
MEKLSVAKHGNDLYDVYGAGSPLRNWTYFPIEPLPDKVQVVQLLEALAHRKS